MFADDWIRTMDLWNMKQLLYQLSHNHFQNKTYFAKTLQVKQTIFPAF